MMGFSRYLKAISVPALQLMAKTCGYRNMRVRTKNANAEPHFCIDLRKLILPQSLIPLMPRKKGDCTDNMIDAETYKLSMIAKFHSI